MFILIKKLKLLLLTIFMTLSLSSCIEADGNTNNRNNPSYNFFLTFGSLPTLYAGLTTFTDNTETYMFYERSGTFDGNKLKQINPHIKGIYHTRDDYSVVRDKVKELYDKDNSATFNLYCDDLRVQLEITLFLEQGIPEKNYNMTLLSDGTGTYGLAFDYKTEGSYGKFLENKEIYDNHYILAAEGESSGLSKDINAIEMAKNAYYASQKHNVRYWMQYPELVKSEDLNINEQVKLSNIEKVLPTKLFNSLSPVRKKQFATVANVEVETYNTYFKDNGKKDLVITGTMPTVDLEGTPPAGSDDRTNFNTVINRIVELYGDEYNLYFKAHPAYPVEIIEGRKEFLEANDIVILPAGTPMEILMWYYPNLYVGGYNSSLYMNIHKYQTLFFIVDAPEKLVAPLDSLYELGHFTTAAGDDPMFIPINYSV